MAEPPPRLLAFLREHRLDVDFLDPGVPMHTVRDAASAVGVDESLILKTLLFTDTDGHHVIAVASGNDRLDRGLLAAASGLGKLKMADPATVLRLTGYPAGGVAPFGFPAPLPVLVDARTAALDVGYGGGGVPELLMRVRIADVVRANAAAVAALVAPPQPDRP